MKCLLCNFNLLTEDEILGYFIKIHNADKNNYFIKKMLKVFADLADGKNVCNKYKSEGMFSTLQT